jgi:hypothetical protein
VKRAGAALALAFAACSPGGGQAVISRPPTSSTLPTSDEVPTIVVESLPAHDDGLHSDPVPSAEQGPTTTTVYVPDNSVANGPLPVDVSGTLACIRSFEGDYDTDTGNGYAGAYQFDQETWESVGGSGNPADASPDEQDARAAQLLEERGLAPWPTPSRRCS